MKKLIKSLVISSFLLFTPQKALSWVENNISDTKWKASQILSHNINPQEIKKKFGFDIKYLDSDGLDTLYNIDYYTQKEIDEVIFTFYKEVLSKYPEWFIKKAYIREIYLLKDIKDKSWNQIGWFELRWKIFLNASWNNIHQFHHELFHRYDNKDWNEDNDQWKNHFWDVQKSKSKNFSSGMSEIEMWYADKYWKTQWIDEDQATIVEYLLSPNKRKKFFNRLQSDEVLRKKSMIITWAFFDVYKWNFSRNLTLDEYQQLSWFSEYEYYSKWSLKDWKIYMDYNFWNNI